MALERLAAKEPYVVSEEDTQIEWWIEVEYPEDAESSKEYVVVKRSPNPTVAVELAVNITPFAEDYFIHTPLPLTPVGIEGPVTGERVILTITDPYPYAQYITYDGWEVYPENTIGLSCTETLRTVSVGSQQYVTANMEDTSSVLYTIDGVETYSLDKPTYVPPEPPLIDYGEGSYTFPVLPTGMTLPSTANIIKISGKDATGTELWSISYELVCFYDELLTIGFINRFGVWEFFDVAGRVVRGVSTESKNYIQYGTGAKRKYGNNGNRSYTVNTGWVAEGFATTIEDLMLSESVILYTGDIETSVPLYLNTESMNLQTSKTEKMISYELSFDVATKVISII